MSVTITFRLMKNDRDDDGELYVYKKSILPPLTEHSLKLTLWEDRQYPHLCPIILFRTLAVADDAFEHIDDPEDLFPVHLKRDVVHVRVKESALDTPLFICSECCDPQWSGPIKAWTFGGASSGLAAWAMRAGCDERITAYAVRRGAVNVLDSEFEAAGPIW